MGGCSLTLKTCLIVMALLLWVAAAGLIYVASVIIATFSHISDLGKSLDILAPSGVILATGIFLFIVGSLGFCSAFKESNCCRATFFVLLFILVAAEITGAGLGLHFEPQVESIATDRLHVMISEYTGAIRDEVDYIQSNLDCCGADSYADWFNSSGSNYTVPQSCCSAGSACRVPTQKFDNSTAIFGQACIPKVKDFIVSHIWYIAGPAIGFATVQILGLVATCWLMCHKEEVPYVSLGKSSGGYRV